MRTVMTPDAFQTWSQLFRLLLETEAPITAIRSSPPVRRVRGPLAFIPVLSDQHVSQKLLFYFSGLVGCTSVLASKRVLALLCFHHG